MTVTRAVIVTLSISLLGLLFVGAYGLWGLLQSQKRSQYVENNTYPAIQALTNVRSSLNEGRIATFLHASTFQAAQKARIGQQIAAYDMAMDQALAAYRNTLVSGVTDSAMLASDRAAWRSRLAGTRSLWYSTATPIEDNPKARPQAVRRCTTSRCRC